MRTTSRVAAALLGTSTALALAVASSWGAAPVPAATVAVSGGGPSAGDTVGGRLTAGDSVSFVVDLAFRDEAAAEALAIAAATPGSPTFGHFLSASEFDRRFGPQAAQVNALRSWISGAGLSVDSEVGDQALVVGGSAQRVSAAFGGVALRSATAHGATGVLADGPLRMPAGAARAVDSIGGLSGPRPAVLTSSYVSDPHPEVAVGPKSLVGPKSPARRNTPARQNTPAHAEPSTAPAAATAPPCSTFFGQRPPGVPGPAPFAATLSSAAECSAFPGGGYYTAASTAKLRTLDSFDPRYLGQGKTVGIVLWGSDGNVLRAANTQARLNGTAVLRPGQYRNVLSHTRVSGCVPVSTDVYLEQNLDVQAVRVLAPAARIRYYADTRCQAPELSLATAVAQDQVQILTNSWLYPNQEYNPENPNSEFFALGDMVHKSLVKAAAEGITVLFASGDTGSGVVARTARHPSPSYPGSDPFAATVGGIGFGTTATGSIAFRSGWTDTEYVYSGRRWRRISSYYAFGPDGIGSTGGVSKVWAAPIWQRKAHVAVGGMRVVPDLSNAASAQFDPFLEVQVLSGVATPEAVAGTSVAVPLTAGQVAGALVAEGRKRLGLITPALYAQRRNGVVSDVFHRQDAVGGTNALGQFVLYGEELPGEALRAKPGWDDVTGLGIPGRRFYQLIGAPSK